MSENKKDLKNKVWKYPKLPKRLKDKLRLKWELKKKWLKNHE